MDGTVAMKKIMWTNVQKFRKLTPEKETIAISIIGTDEEGFTLEGWHPESIQLVFDDVEENDPDWTPMSKSQAKEIIRLIDKFRNRVSWVVHCRAGISRSAAVARVLGEFTDLPLEGTEVPDTRFANTCVISLIHRQIWKGE